jgi:beta-lactam-binding protein with PASTA domain
MSSQTTEDERDRRRRWLLLLLLLLVLLIAALIAFVSCGKTDQTGTTGATPDTWRSAVATFAESPSAAPAPSATAAAMLSMPNVVGKAADDADMTLRAIGFTDVSFVDTAGTPAALLRSWVVARQSVTPGSSVPASEPIVLTVGEKANGRG